MVVIPTRLEPFPAQSVSSTLIVPGRKDFAASQFNYEALSRGKRPPPLPPEQVPPSHVLRPNHTHPHPAWSITFPDPDFSSLPGSDVARIQLRTLIFDTLETPYSSLSNLEFLYLSYWVSERLAVTSPEPNSILTTASQWPGFSRPACPSIGLSPTDWGTPVVTVSDLHQHTLELLGFGGCWVASDCGGG
jgi:hypothetical protein